MLSEKLHFPKWAAEEFYKLLLNGGVISKHVEELLGKKPRTLESTINVSKAFFMKKECCEFVSDLLQ